MISLFIYPFLGILLLSLIHCYFGLHVIKRGVIFADLALSQLAALGACVSVFLPFLPVMVPSLFFTALGAVLFTSFSFIKDKVQQEILIGIVYVISAALCMAIMSKSVLQHHQLSAMLVGDILMITPHALIKMLAIYAAIGLFHWFFRASFHQHSHWFFTFLFYATFGMVVTSSVSVVGILLVFAYLIIPAQFAQSFLHTFRHQLYLGTLVSVLTSVLGILMSIYLDLPTGSSIVCAFVLPLLSQLALKGLLRKP